MADPGKSLRTAESIDTTGLGQALLGADIGEVRFDAQARAMYATDASHYRQVPIGVVLPRSAEEVVRVLEICRRFGAPVTGRGGGTSLAGQCCNTAVVIDYSRFMNRILEIDPERREAWVEPGCVLDDLQNAAAPHGLTFGPDPSTHNHNTLGGMIGNNSCGVHSIMGGRTADNVEELEIVTYDGIRMNVGRTDAAELRAFCARQDRVGEIYRGLVALRDSCAEEVRRTYPDIPRRVSGFNLDELLPERGFNVARALVGTEGTCVTVLRARLRLIPSPPCRTLVVLGFDDIDAAADAVPEVMKHAPIGLEGLDDRLIEFVRQSHYGPPDAHLLPHGRGWLMVELGGETAGSARAKGDALIDDIVPRDREIWGRHITDAGEAKRLWELRKSALGATAHAPATGDTHPGWEDAGLPPARLGDYLRTFRKLLDEFGYDCSIYGHFGDGCVHCRIDFDLKAAAGVKKYLAFIDRAAELVVACGGSLSGEHGDGQSHGVLLEKMFGRNLVGAFRTFKYLWDPEGRMNPGKVVDAYQPDENLQQGPDFRPWSPPVRFAYREAGGDFARVSALCVGIGECRNHQTGIMCPSYRATYREAYSTRGRARLLFEMVHGGVIDDGWKSYAVREALDFCLACKACKHECPVQVDMASYKAEFMHHHYAWRLRPRHDYAMGLIWWWARAASHAPGLVNALTHAPGLSRLAKWAGGFAAQREIPRFAARPFHRWFAESGPQPRGNAAKGDVVLWPDTFNAYFTTGPLRAAATFLASRGYRVRLPEKPVCCGRPLYAPGMLSLATRLWRRNLDVLRPIVRDGTPIVVVEPACASAFRDELPNLMPHDEDALRLSRQARLFSEFVAQESLDLPGLSGAAVVHGHCHHRSVLDMDSELSVLRRAGLDASLLDSTCCGMAGDFGFRALTYDVAMRAGEQDFLPALRTTAERDLFVADGFSCREQARQSGCRVPVTLPEILAAGEGRQD